MTSEQRPASYALGFKVLASNGPVMVSRGGRHWPDPDAAIAACDVEEEHSIATVLANCVVELTSGAVYWVPRAHENRIKAGEFFAYVGDRAPRAMAKESKQ